MRRSRGFTLVEMVLASALTATLTGALAALYLFSVGRAAHASANATVLQQLQTLLNSVERTVSSSVRCEVVTSGPNSALKCVMPAAGTDRDSDGYLDTYRLTSVSKRGLGKFGEGKRVWFYLAGSTGAFGTSGTILWRAERSDDAAPLAGDVDANWSYYYGSAKEKFGLVETFSFSVNPAARTTTVGFNVNSWARAERRAPVLTSTDEQLRYAVNLQRTVFWRNWRR